MFVESSGSLLVLLLLLLLLLLSLVSSDTALLATTLALAPTFASGLLSSILAAALKSSFLARWTLGLMMLGTTMENKSAENPRLIRWSKISVQMHRMTQTCCHMKSLCAANRRHVMK
jgi:hypothetical protein